MSIRIRGLALVHCSISKILQVTTILEFCPRSASVNLLPSRGTYKRGIRFLVGFFLLCQGAGLTSLKSMAKTYRHVRKQRSIQIVNWSTEGGRRKATSSEAVSCSRVRTSTVHQLDLTYMEQLSKVDSRIRRT